MDWIPMIEAVREQEHPAKPDDPIRQGPLPSPPSILGANQDDEPTPKGRRKAVFPISEGDVIITFPSDLSNDALAELREYLDILFKKKKRGTKSLGL